jgi:hypothetical protein
MFVSHSEPEAKSKLELRFLSSCSAPFLYMCHFVAVEHRGPGLLGGNGGTPHMRVAGSLRTIKHPISVPHSISGERLKLSTAHVLYLSSDMD